MMLFNQLFHLFIIVLELFSCEGTESSSTTTSFLSTDCISSFSAGSGSAIGSMTKGVSFVGLTTGLEMGLYNLGISEVTIKSMLEINPEILELTNQEIEILFENYTF